MENKGYLNEERYQQNNAKVKRIGKILLIVGIIVFILGLVVLVLGFMNFGNTANNAIETVDSYGYDNNIYLWSAN